MEFQPKLWNGETRTSSSPALTASSNILSARSRIASSSSLAAASASMLLWPKRLTTWSSTARWLRRFARCVSNSEPHAASGMAMARFSYPAQLCDISKCVFMQMSRRPCEGPGRRKVEQLSRCEGCNEASLERLVWVCGVVKWCAERGNLWVFAVVRAELGIRFEAKMERMTRAGPKLRQIDSRDLMRG